MTTVYFGGAEAPTLRSRLLHAGARAVSVGLLDLWPRLGEEGAFVVPEKVPDTKVLLDLQGGAATRRELTHEQASLYVETMLRLVYDNRNEIDGVVEFDYEPWGHEGVEEGRAAFFDNLAPGLFLPVWHPEWEEFEALAERYPRIAIPGDTIKALSPSEARRIRKAVLTDNLRVHALGTSAQDEVTDLRVDSLSFSSWIACTSRGETTLWERNRIRRYRGEEKEEVRRDKRALIEQAGVDPDEVADDDPQALTTLAVSAWQHWGDHNARGRSGQPETERPSKDLQPAAPTPVQPTRYRWNGEAPEGMTTLPLLAPEKSEQGGGYEISTTQESMRRCGTCSLAGLCPMTADPDEDDACRIAIPVEIRDKSQLVATLRTMLEIQGQRALFSKFAEDVEGAGASSETSSELDRFMRMAQQMRDVLENRDFLRVTVEGNGKAAGGVLSQLFGKGVGQQARTIDPEAADEVIAEVLDG